MTSYKGKVMNHGFYCESYTDWTTGCSTQCESCKDQVIERQAETEKIIESLKL